MTQFPGLSTADLNTRVISVVTRANGHDIQNPDRVNCTFYEAITIARVPHSKAWQALDGLRRDGTIGTYSGGVQTVIHLR